MSLEKCDICLVKTKSTIKCKICSFWIHEPCLVKWFSTCGNFCCPSCTTQKSYSIDYSKVVFAPKENQDEDILGYIRQTVDSQTTTPEPGERLNPTFQILNPLFSELPLDIVVSEILKEGQIFTPDTFIINFNTLPIQIRAQWKYESIKMEINGTEEIIGYQISKRNNE